MYQIRDSPRRQGQDGGSHGRRVRGFRAARARYKEARRQRQRVEGERARLPPSADPGEGAQGGRRRGAG